MAWNRVNKDFKLVSSTPQVCASPNVDPYAFFPLAEPDTLYYAFNDIEQIKDCIRHGLRFRSRVIRRVMDSLTVVLWQTLALMQLLKA